MLQKSKSNHYISLTEDGVEICEIDEFQYSTSVDKIPIYTMGNPAPLYQHANPYTAGRFYIKGKWLSGLHSSGQLDVIITNLDTLALEVLHNINIVHSPSPSRYDFEAEFVMIHGPLNEEA